jgi:ribosomal protein S8
MNVSKEDFIREIQRRKEERRRKKAELNYACAQVRLRGIRSVSHNKRKAYEP